MISPSITFFHGLLICVPFTIFALVTFWMNPRLWLHSLPPDIIQQARPKTLREKAITKYLLLPLYLLILPGMSILSTLWVIGFSEATFSFLGVLVHLYGLWIVVHLWDFLVLDCIAILIIDSKKPPIRGTAGAKGWKDVSFHFHSFIKAAIFSGTFVLPVSFMLWLISISF
jgi:hypothetical protein